MQEEIKEIYDKLKYISNNPLINGEYDEENYLFDDEAKLLLDDITNLQEKVDQYENPEDYTLFYMWLDEKAKDKMKELQEENKRLKELCDKYEEEHNTTFIEWQKDINIIDGLEKWLKEQVFNKAGSSVDLAIENHSYCKVLDKLNELKGDNK